MPCQPHQSVASLDSHPLEIPETLARIFIHIQHGSDLAACARVNRVWSREASKCLWPSLRRSIGSAWDSAYSTFDRIENPRFGSYETHPAPSEIKDATPTHPLLDLMNNTQSGLSGAVIRRLRAFQPIVREISFESFNQSLRSWSKPNPLSAHAFPLDWFLSHPECLKMINPKAIVLRYPPKHQFPNCPESLEPLFKPNLSRIVLKFDHSSIPTPEHLQAIQTNCHHLRLLSIHDFILPLIRPRAEALPEISVEFASHFPKLQTVRFQGDYKPDPGRVLLALLSKPSMTCLSMSRGSSASTQSLHLTLESVEELERSLKSCTSCLRELELCLPWASNDQGMEQLFPLFPNLQRLAIKEERSRHSSSDVNKILRGISTCRSLSVLDICVDGSTKIQESGKDSLKILSQNNPHLRALHLDLMPFPGRSSQDTTPLLTDAELEQFTKPLSSLELFEVGSRLFEGFAGLSVLARNLPHLKTLLLGHDVVDLAQFVAQPIVFENLFYLELDELTEDMSLLDPAKPKPKVAVEALSQEILHGLRRSMPRLREIFCRHPRIQPLADFIIENVRKAAA